MLAHGLTAVPGAAAYGRWATSMGDETEDMLLDALLREGRDKFDESLIAAARR